MVIGGRSCVTCNYGDRNTRNLNLDSNSAQLCYYNGTRVHINISLMHCTCHGSPVVVVSQSSIHIMDRTYKIVQLRVSDC